MIKKAIIPAAGYGTRSLPITKVLPKEMFPINGRPAIHYIVEEAVQAGVEEILIVVSSNKNMIVDYFDTSLELEAFLKLTNKSNLLDKLRTPDVHIQYTRQPYARGLGDAVRLGKSFVGNDPFMVLLPDDIILNKNGSVTKQIMNVFNELHSPVIALRHVRDECLNQYGVVEPTYHSRHIHEIRSIVEKPQTNPPSNLAVIGRYAFTSNIFEYLTRQEESVNSEVQLTDAIQTMLTNEKCYGFEVEGDRYDIGIEKDYIQLLQRLNEEKDEQGS
ncbi:UTP--glucose-1-phosphate uridylyltransferase [Pseudalkalibacillus berkeleyi]|uniref:UTP--glucose-1-phosphate uridylyltransferase n=1 Tax=Pseudalkalibacillus berkeleyi TaxID=1069813 RepID=A0ABS9GVR3_9BACL|nr:UTP--glucose-1-phosphate uridylyltransferase [Pseudalkalibacillus berkeleyi]MCF6136903.1 UTP--glucose-1-phosphate uridylyltransferase [Pseudalkalibacillus berkeleyi]